MQVKRHCAVKYRMYPNRAQAALIFFAAQTPASLGGG